MLGIRGVQTVAAALELAFVQGADGEALRDRAQVLGDELRRIVAELERALAKVESAGECVRPAALREGLVKLRRLLESDEVGAAEVWQVLQGAARAVNGPAAERLGRDIERFAYAEALRTLDELDLA